MVSTENFTVLALIATTILAVVLAWVSLRAFRNMNSTRSELVACRAKLIKTQQKARHYRELFTDKVIYKAITHRYNNVRGGDRFRCLEIKKAIEKIRSRHG